MIWDALYIGKVIYASCKDLSGVSLKVYPLRIPQETAFPALTYSILSVDPEDTKDSRSLCDTVTFQINLFASTYTLVTSLAQLVREALDGLSGENSGVSVDYMRFESWIDDYDDEFLLFRKDMTFSCRVKNDASTNINASVLTALSVTNDYTWADAIPAGYLLESFVIEESAGSTGQISSGTTVSGTNIFSAQTITGGGLTIIETNKAFSLTAAQTIYFNDVGSGDNWNGMNCTIYAIMRKIN